MCLSELGLPVYLSIDMTHLSSASSRGPVETGLMKPAWSLFLDLWTALQRSEETIVFPTSVLAP